MRQSAEVDQIAKALVAIAAELRAVEKAAVNPHFKNKYTSLDSLTAYARPVCASHGVAILQGGGDMTNGGLQVETVMLHESGQWIGFSCEMPLEKATAQSAGSALTYGRRYGLAAILAISSEEDDDGNAASQPKARQRNQAAAKPPVGSEGSGTPAAADSTLITRESKLTFGKMEGTPIHDLKDSYLQWALEDGRTFGKRTKEWQAAFREELASRDGVTA